MCLPQTTSKRMSLDVAELAGFVDLKMALIARCAGRINTVRY